MKSLVYINMLDSQYWSTVDLAEVPLDILEKIALKLSFKERDTNVCKVNQRLKEAAYEVVYVEYLALQEQICNGLHKVKKEIKYTIVNRENYQDYLVLINIFGFLQVVEAEYRILKEILSQKESLINSVVPFKVIKCIDELYSLLDNFIYYQWTGSTDTNCLMEHLTELNSDIGGHFLSYIWDPKMNPFGPLLIRLLGCCLCSKFNAIISYDSPPKFKDSMCYLTGSYEVPDFSCAAPPFRSRANSPETFARELILYIWRTIRWINSFHVLRLRWVSINRALTEGIYNYYNDEWLLVDAKDPYLNPGCLISTKREIPYNNTKRVCKKVKKLGENTQNEPFNNIGISCKFKMWCPLSEVPKEMFSTEDLLAFSLLPYRPPRRRRYSFELDLRSYIVAKARKTRNIIVTCASVKESPQGFSYKYNKNLFF